MGFGGIEDGLGGAQDQIIGDIDVTVELQFRAARGLVIDLKRVSERNGLKDGAEFVETVGALVEHPKIEVDLGQALEFSDPHSCTPEAIRVMFRREEATNVAASF